MEGGRRRPGKPTQAKLSSAGRIPAASGVVTVASLLFVSGAAALVYQLTWLRLLRLVFGHSTAATAAVLAIFMGGLGLGALLLGRRADKHPNPLRFYAALEAGLALSAAASPFLIDLVRSLYLATGGSAELGSGLATVLRLLLSAAVLGVPTVLMGATLPAAARAVEPGGEQRWRTAVLYGCNTLGAVTGVVLGNFVLLEALGTRATLLAAAALNGALAAAAWVASRGTGSPAAARAVEESVAAPVPDRRTTTRLVIATAGIAGFAFLLMELVWYRLLAPLLGGSTYTFGIILAVALLGIGLGGLAYALEPPSARRLTLGRLALVTALEALCAIVPFAIGDRLALLAITLSSLSVAGFAAIATAWFALAAIVVLPMAVVAGYQLPLLIDLAGANRDEVGSDVARVYASNTAGSIAASLAGGFGLIPGLGALGAWRLSSMLLLGLAAVGAVMSRRGEGSSRAVWGVGAVAAFALLFGMADGPTAVWRHSPIGAFVTRSLGDSANTLRSMVGEAHRSLVWEEDGVESTVAVTATDGLSLMMNGKSDGNAVADASTTIMLGMVPAVFHPSPKRALVIGLGMGSTAGWLASIPTIERVDVVELEPAVLRAARDAASINRGALSDPKVRIVVGDAREYLLTTGERYDIIVSEPSNPYRAGVASLFTTEFYEAARRALADGGVFAQWVQAYAVSDSTIKTVVATIASEFDAVEAWEVQLGADLLLVAREQALSHDVARLAERVNDEPWRSALRIAWGLAGVQGLYTGFVAGPEMAREVLRATPPDRLNTDDSTVIEFEFARSLDRADDTLIEKIRETASKRQDYAPVFAEGGSMVWGAVAELRPARSIHEEKGFSADRFEGSADAMARNRARIAYASGRLAETVREWDSQGSAPLQPIDVVMMAEALADGADERALALAGQLRAWSAADAEAVLARYSERKGDAGEAARHLEWCFAGMRESGWGYRPLLRRAVSAAVRLATLHPDSTRRLFDALAEPFAVRVVEDRRRHARATIAMAQAAVGQCAAELAAIEPWVYMDRDFLEKRVKCYERTGSPLLARARADLAAYREAAPLSTFDPAAPRSLD